MPGPKFAVLWGVYVRAVLGWFGKIIGILGNEYAASPLLITQVLTASNQRLNMAVNI